MVKSKLSIGSIDALGGDYLIDYDYVTQTLTENDMSESDSDEDEDQALDNLFKSVTQGGIDLDAIMVSSAHAGK